MRCYQPYYLKDDVKVPCGNCFSCRQNRTNEWARRIIHESTVHKYVTFLTLTYDDNKMPFVPESTHVHRREMVLFLKRLRKHFKKPIRYFGVSQYGDQGGRLHYHFILFGIHPGHPAIQKAWSYCFYDKIKRAHIYEPIGFIKSKSFIPKNAYYISRYVARVYDSLKPVALSVSRRPFLGFSVAKKNFSRFF